MSKTNAKTLEEVQKEIAAIAAKEGNYVSDLSTPISKVKDAPDIDLYYKLNDGFSFWSVQLAGDYAARYYQTIEQYFHTTTVLPKAETPVAILERAIDPRLNDLTFSKLDGTSTDKLHDYLFGASRKQAMMMAHKGKVVFEAFPGMNTNEAHLWMSSGKTTVSTCIAQLVAEGKVDLQKMTSHYVPELQGTLWDEIPLWATATMSPGLDVEETFVSLVTPGSWINNFDLTMLGEYNESYIDQLRAVKWHPSGEKPGHRFRYCSGTTMCLQFVCEAIDKKPFHCILQERVWSKVGFRFPAQIVLAPNGTTVGYGMFSTIPEDMLRYAMLFTPSWNKVAAEPVVTEEMNQILRSAAKKESYYGCTEQPIASQWFGEKTLTQGLQWDVVFEDGAMFKHGNNGQGIYVDPKRDFCAMNFACADNNAGMDYGPGYMRAAAKFLAGE